MKLTPRLLLSSAIIFVALSLLDPAAYARPIKIWSYAELADGADLIVLATAQSSKEESLDAAKLQPGAQVPINTTFKPSAALKGKLQDNTIVLLHYRYAGNMIPPNGANFITFDTTGKTEYLMFLKKRDDGRYEPVAGQLDPNLSVRLVEPFKQPSPPATPAGTP